MKTLKDFANLYPVSKTLRFRLIPEGRTEENIKKYSILETDYERSQKYKTAKLSLDDLYKTFISESLCDASFSKEEKTRFTKDFIKLSELENIVKEDRAEYSKQYYKHINEIRKNLVAHIRKHPDYEVYSKGNTGPVMKKLFAADPSLEPIFKGFGSYFTLYLMARGNLFDDTGKAMALATRIVDENFPRFEKNIKALSYMKAERPMLYNKIVEQYPDIESFFSYDNYINLCTQTNISLYNTYINGYTMDDAEKKVPGINEIINQYYQQTDKNLDVKKCRCTNLYKMLLEDEISFSYIPYSCKTQEEMFEVIRDTENSTFEKTIQSLSMILGKIEDESIFYSDDIYLSNKQVSELSLLMFGKSKWNGLFEKMEEEKLNELTKAKKKTKDQIVKLTKADKAESEKAAKQSFYSFSYLASICRKIKGKINYPLKDALVKTVGSLITNMLDAKKIFNSYIFEGKNVRINEDASTIVRIYLENCLEATRFVSSMIVPDTIESDALFYEELANAKEIYKQNVKTYNVCRNFITMKSSDIAKQYKLNFNCAHFAEGWSESKEESSFTQLLRKDGNTYLVIKNRLYPGKNKMLSSENCPVKDESDVFEKMTVNSLPSPMKAFPAALFAMGNRDLPYAPSKSLCSVYDRKKEGLTEEYWLPEYKSERDYQVALMDYYIHAVPQHRNWSTFGFKFRKAEEYESLSEFFEDAEKTNFTIRLDKLDAASVYRLADEGCIFLFRLYNSDYSPYSYGECKNLFTLYWEYMFSKENFEKGIIKINGGAEIYFRPSIGEVKITHPKGSMLVPRSTKTGKPVPQSIYYEIYNYVNHKSSRISTEARSWMENINIHEADKDLIKDKRFYEDQYFLHVPLTYNFKANAKDADINKLVYEMIRTNPDVNIMGIDRGERNLIYLTIINQKGEVIHQESLNTIINGKGNIVNWAEKLTAVERERDNQRKTWNTISKIADIKKGFVAASVNHITTLMVKYNAVLALEDLTSEFKHARSAIERSVYQQLESALISKLSLFADKHLSYSENGSVACPLQLTTPFESFEKMKTINGCLFFVNPSFTSRVDPVSGFADLFNYREYGTEEKMRAFFSKFDSITYDGREDFIFEFDYKNFEVYSKTKISRWTITSKGDRSATDPDNPRKRILYKPSNSIRGIFKDLNICYEDKRNLVPAISAIEPTRNNMRLIKELFDTFCSIIMMRNYTENEDFFISPVINKTGMIYDSRNFTASAALPCEGDANDAYNIARKALILFDRIKQTKEDEKINFGIKNEEYLNYCQNR